MTQHPGAVLQLCCSGWHVLQLALFGWHSAIMQTPQGLGPLDIFRRCTSSKRGYSLTCLAILIKFAKDNVLDKNTT